MDTPNDVNNILYMLCRISSHLFSILLSVRHYAKYQSESQLKRIAGFKSKFVNKVLVSFLAIQKFSEYLSGASIEVLLEKHDRILNGRNTNKCCEKTDSCQIYRVSHLLRFWGTQTKLKSTQPSRRADGIPWLSQFYRVTHQVGPSLLLTSKQMLGFSICSL